MNKVHFSDESASLKDANNHFSYAYVHPCVINDKPHVVYSKGLQQKSPSLFEKLSQYYQKQGYALKEDQRSGEVPDKYKNERRKWVPVILFSASLLFESSAFADVELEVDETASLKPEHQVELQLISNEKIRKQIESNLTISEQSNEPIEISSEIAQSLFNEFSKRYKKQKNDPSYIINDLKEIANYYSRFPESITLIEELKDKNWSLSFDEDNWVTTGSGNRSKIDKAVIHFNTRSAAQLRLNNGCENNPVCIASPADAMLHELLHTHSMLVNSDEFIAQGGLNDMMYPYEHEYAVIDSERKLYATMSRQDNIKRPQRRDHTGRTVKAHCPTCIK